MPSLLQQQSSPICQGENPNVDLREKQTMLVK